MSTQAAPAPEPPQTIAHPSCFFSANRTLYAYTKAAELYALDLSSSETTFAWKLLGSPTTAASNNGIHQNTVTTCGVLANEGLVVVMTDKDDHIYDITERRWHTGAGNGADRSRSTIGCAGQQGQMVVYDGIQAGLWDVASATWTSVPAQDGLSPPLSTNTSDTLCVSAGTFVYYLYTAQDQHGRITNDLYGLDSTQRRWLGYLGSFWSENEHVELGSGRDLSVEPGEETLPILLYAFPDQDLYTFTLRPDGIIDPWFAHVKRPAEIGGSKLLGTTAAISPTAYYTTNFGDDLIAFYDNDEHVTLYNPSLNQVVEGYTVPRLPTPQADDAASSGSANFWDSPEGYRAKIAIGCGVAAAFLLWVCAVCILWRFCRSHRSRRIATTSQMSSLEEPQSIEKSVDTSISKKTSASQDNVKAFYFTLDPKANGEDASAWGQRVCRTLAYIVYQYHQQQQQDEDGHRPRTTSSSTLSIKTVGNMSSTTHVSSSIGSRLRRFDANSTQGHPSRSLLTGHGGVDHTVAAAVNMVIRRALHLGRSPPNSPPSTGQDDGYHSRY